jgi:DNA-binding MarR family transcriptional regulator
MNDVGSRPPAPGGPGLEDSGRFAYDGLERAIHEKARLGIMTSLSTHPRGLLFNDLKELCHLTDGNLSRHLQVLHDEGLVEIWKGTTKRRPQTLVRLTEAGRRRFLDYLATLERVVADALRAARSAQAPAADAPPVEGWSPA